MPALPEAELWSRLRTHLGDAYAPTWAASVVLGELGDRTVTEALSDGVPCATIWRAAWAFLELPAREL